MGAPYGRSLAQATSTSGLTWSPDGRRLAFSNYDGTMTVPAAGDAPPTLVAPPGTGSPAFGPDGQLAYAQYPTPSGAGKLVVMANDGTRRELATDLDHFGHPTWSRDGRRIVYASNGGLRVVASEGGPSHGVGLLAAVNETVRASWSPDGAVIFYSAHGNLRAVGVDGANDRIVIPDAGGPKAAPTEALIAFVERVTWDVQVARPDGTDRRVLATTTTGRAGAHEVAWSPLGNAVGFVVRDSSG